MPDVVETCPRCGSQRTWDLTSLPRTYEVRWWGRLAVLFGAIAVVLNAVWMSEWWLTGDPELTARLNTFSNLMNWATLVVIAIWLWRSVRNADAFPGSTGRRGAGWALGGWFLPIVNIWMPIQVMAETAEQELDAWWLTPAAVFWWLAVMFHRMMFARTQFLAYYGDRPTIVDALLSAAALGVAGTLLAVLVLPIGKAQQARVDRARARRDAR